MQVHGENGWAGDSAEEKGGFVVAEGRRREVRGPGVPGNENEVFSNPMTVTVPGSLLSWTLQRSAFYGCKLCISKAVKKSLKCDFEETTKPKTHAKKVNRAIPNRL